MLDQIDANIAEQWTSHVALLGELVRIPSITGSENGVQERVANQLGSLGLTVDMWHPLLKDVENHPAYCDDGIPLGDRPVVVGRWQGSGEGRSLILNGHVDVVPAGDESLWPHGPWRGEVVDERLFGRGSCDMKAGLVAAMAAVSALQQASFEPRGDVLVQSVIGEETGGVGTLAAIERGYRADGAVIMEPTELAMAPAGSGALSYRITVHGRAAHGGLREEGYSALDAFLPIHQALKRLEYRRHQRFDHPLFTTGPLAAPLSTGMLRAGDWVSTVPEELVAEGRYGVFVGETPDEARAEFMTALYDACARDDWLAQHRPEVEWFEGQFESGQTQPDAAGPVATEHVAPGRAVELHDHARLGRGDAGGIGGGTGNAAW